MRLIVASGEKIVCMKGASSSSPAAIRRSASSCSPGAAPAVLPLDPGQMLRGADARLDEVRLAALSRGVLCPECLAEIASPRVHLDEVPVVFPVRLQCGCSKVGGGPLAFEVVPPGRDRHGVDVIALESGGHALVLSHFAPR